MKGTRMIPAGVKAFVIQVDSYVDGNMTGFVNCALLPAPVKFKSTTNFVLLVEGLLDRLEGEKILARPPTKGFKADLELEVLFRQNHSWQGRVRMVSENRESTFRSVLELLVLLDNIFGV